MNCASLFIFCHDISAVALPKSVSLSHISSDIFDSVSNVTIFAKDLSRSSQSLQKILHRVCLEILDLLKPQPILIWIYS